MISNLESVAQAENESRSENTRWGNKKRAANGSSGFLRRQCYGYRDNKNGDLEIVPDEAQNVRYFFEAYLNGASLNMIKRKLQECGTPSSTGKETWCKRIIDELPSNVKYCGDVMLMKTFRAGGIGSKRKRNDGHADKYLALSNHPPIIDKEALRMFSQKRPGAAMLNGLKRESREGPSGILPREDIQIKNVHFMKNGI